MKQIQKNTKGKLTNGLNQNVDQSNCSVTHNGKAERCEQSSTNSNNNNNNNEDNGQ